MSIVVKRGTDTDSEELDLIWVNIFLYFVQAFDDLAILLGFVWVVYLC